MEMVSKKQARTILEWIIDEGQEDIDERPGRQPSVTFSNEGHEAALSLDTEGRWWWTSYNGQPLVGVGCNDFGYLITDDVIVDMLYTIVYHSDPQRLPNDSEIMAWLESENKKLVEGTLSGDAAFWKAIDRAWSTLASIQEAVIMEVREDNSVSIRDLLTDEPESKADSKALRWINDALDESNEAGECACHAFLAVMSEARHNDTSITEEIAKRMKRRS